MWSFSAPDDRVSRYATCPSPDAPARLADAATAGTTSPSPSPSPSPPESESGSSGEDPRPASLSPDEAFRQSQLIMEISKKVINVGEFAREFRMAKRSDQLFGSFSCGICYLIVHCGCMN